MENSYWVDSHCHLYPDLQEEVDQVIKNAHAANIQVMLSICTDLKEFPGILSLAEKEPSVFCTIGAHPHETSHHTSLAIADFLEATVHPKVVGIGETGLDFYYTHSPEEIQKESFRVHVAVHKATGLPLVIHSRDGEADLLKILRDENVGPINGKAPGVIHCFSGTEEFAFECLDLGFYISISGIVTFKKADFLRDIVKKIPLERILVETDAPFLAPVPYRGQRNEPAFMIETAKCVADLKGISFEELQTVTTENFHSLFWKVPRCAPER
ncbi:MAG: LuxR family transcriptional regulator [Alphaproteobacteria bacterium 16-39-46]|nr:MAG: LuxR family transcriptional regulator [Alphaproteobacteria bacterium 16-39-46]OZA44371.1 MAG: LuxR family transcriptional regulator [Alphaproteobacteria bacterium 17-39-52]HQS83439.1 TatD family hydrolase [Alphaproteobacteria bacterium]HQS93203.1 TatD family hydrolase [Alphaproteobacteria bacterium]